MILLLARVQQHMLLRNWNVNGSALIWSLNTLKWQNYEQMTLDELEILERTTFEMVVQAITDYVQESVVIFREEQDMPGDIAQDVMREALEEMGLPGIRERLYGKVDYKKAIYVFLPHPQPVALMLDAKAEKGNSSATIQMSQTSMHISELNPIFS